MKLKNIFGKKINVNGKPREADEVFEEKGNASEVNNLIAHGYLEEVKEKEDGQAEKKE